MSIKNTIARMCCLLLATSFLPACEEGEVAVGLGAAAIVVGLHTLDDDYDHDHYDHDHYDYDHHDRIRRERQIRRDREAREARRHRQAVRARKARREKREREERRRKRRLQGGSGSYAQSFTGSAEFFDFGAHTHEELILDWSAVYDIPVDSAETLVGSFQQSREGDINGMKSLGFNQKDIKAMSKLKLPSQASLETASQALNLPVAKTQEIIEDIVLEMADQFRDVDSPVWQQCMDAKYWKTPQNMYCTRTEWKGCSPKTGAQACTPVQ